MDNLSYKSVLLCTITTIGLVIMSYYYVDKPVVWFMHAQGMRQYRFVHYMQKIPDIFLLLLPLILVWAVYRWYTKTVSHSDQVLILASFGFVTALVVTYLLKFIFGRYWPTTFNGENVSLINNGVYGFNFFRRGPAYRSFPSGHTAAIFTVATILWRYAPRLRGLAIGMCSFVVTGVIGCYYHFVSDVIAGALVGVGVGGVMLSWHAKLFDTKGWCRQHRRLIGEDK